MVLEPISGWAAQLRTPLCVLLLWEPGKAVPRITPRAIMQEAAAVCRLLEEQKFPKRKIRNRRRKKKKS